MINMGWWGSVSGPSNNKNAPCAEGLYKVGAKRVAGAFFFKPFGMKLLPDESV